MLVLLLGALLFWLRAKRRLYHGMLEVFAGFLLGLFSTLHATHWQGTTVARLMNAELLPVILALFSGIFIVVRGLDNIQKH